MSRLIMGMSGVLALSLISGAAEFARGRDLSMAAGNATPITQALFFSSGSGRSAEGIASVNRGTKGDRAAAPVGSPATRTISLSLDGFSDTSFLLRLPASVANPPAPAMSTIRAPMVACEPVVSILTEVAKRLEPGSCIA